MIFWRLKFFIPGYFFGRKIWQVFFWVVYEVTDLGGVVLGIKHSQRKCFWVSLVLLK